MEAIRPNAYVFIRLASDNTKIVQIIPNTTISLGKFGSFPANALIGRPYYLSWDILDGAQFGLRHVPTEELVRDQIGGPMPGPKDDNNATNSPGMTLEETALDIEVNSQGEDDIESPAPIPNALQEWDKEMKNNKDIRDDRSAQTMTWEEIEALKRSGETGGGKDIISKLLSSHAHIDKKTAFSLAKYTLRKTQKYLKRMTVLPADIPQLTGHLLAEKEPLKIMELRDEGLGLMMSWADIKWGGRWLVIDETGGLVVGAVAERMGLLPMETKQEKLLSKPDEGANGHKRKLDEVVSAEIAEVVEKRVKTEINGNHETATTQTEATSASVPHSTSSKKDIPVPTSNTITLLHTADQPNVALLRHFDFDLSDPNPSHPMTSHLLTLSYLQLITPHLDPTLHPRPEIVHDAELKAWKASKRSNYYRKIRKWERTVKIVQQTRAGGFDGIVIASGMELGGILRTVVPLLRGSAQVVIYGSYVEPLSEVSDWCSTLRRTEFLQRVLDGTQPMPERDPAFNPLQSNEEAESNGHHENGKASTGEAPSLDNLPPLPIHTPTLDFPIDPTTLLAPTIHTSRVRHFQALPGRTHPVMTTRGGAEGYILHATKVFPIVGEKIEARGRYTRSKKPKKGDVEEMKDEDKSAETKMDYDIENMD